MSLPFTRRIVDQAARLIHGPSTIHQLLRNYTQNIDSLYLAFLCCVDVARCAADVVLFSSQPSRHRSASIRSCSAMARSRPPHASSAAITSKDPSSSARSWSRGYRCAPGVPKRTSGRRWRKARNGRRVRVVGKGRARVRVAGEEA